MKFSEMPYKRVELADVEAGYKDIIARTKAATSGEDQFAIHRDYYKFFADKIIGMSIRRFFMNHRTVMYWRRRSDRLCLRTLRLR